MSIYYAHNNKINATRLSGDSPNVAISKNKATSLIFTKYEFFGTDKYILNKLKFKPIFKLYQKVYQ